MPERSRAATSGPRIVAVAAALFALAAPTAASAFCRTTSKPIPPTYNPARTGCFTEGLPLFWRNACVGFSLNRAASARIPLDTATPIVDQAFSTWANATCPSSGAAVGITPSDLGPVDCAEVRYNPAGGNQNVIIFRDDDWPYQDPNNTLGLTTVTFNAETGEIYDADMEINASQGNLSAGAIVPRDGYDLLSVVTHEAGHFLGLAHATDPGATMFASYKPGSSTLRVLSSDDVAGICTIYPSATERSVASSVEASGVLPAGACDPNPRHGFATSCEGAPPEDEGGCSVSRGSTEPAGALATALAAAVLAFAAGPRRRRRAR